MTKHRHPSLSKPAVHRSTKKIDVEPKFGGSRGYPHLQRRESISLQARGVRTVASKRSVRRWKNRIVAFASTGNKCTRKLSGIYMYLLVLYRRTHPKCTLDEMRAFLYRALAPPILFSRSEICVAEINLNFSRKRGSTTAFQASLQHNLDRRRLYWGMPPPIGVNGVNRLRFIDSDECAFFVQICNRTLGKAYICQRVRQDGHYGHDLKFTLILAVDCNGFKHVQLRPVAGTACNMFS